MNVKDGYTFDQVYDSYLAWFHERATVTAKPKGKEELLGYQLCHEDVFEGEGFLLNRMFFLVPLLPSESKSGQMETFTVSELNLLRETGGADGSFDQATPVEYRFHSGG